MAKNKKESFFWTSYSDLMTSLFFIMLVLFVIVIVVMGKRMIEQEVIVIEYEQAKKIRESTTELSNNGNFIYQPEYKKYQLRTKIKYPPREYDINNIIADDKAAVHDTLAAAGIDIQKFLERHSDNQYILIIEGQASRDNYAENYELSYRRALGLLKFWMNDRGITFGKNCEIQISGSGDGRLETRSPRESINEENQRFLIYILPKNILEENEN